MNMENDLKEELNRRMRAVWAEFAPVSYGPPDGPRSFWPSVRLDSSSSALLHSGDLRAQLDTAHGSRQRHSRNLRTSWMTMARKRGNKTSGRDAGARTSSEYGPSKYFVLDCFVGVRLIVDAINRPDKYENYLADSYARGVERVASLLFGQSDDVALNLLRLHNQYSMAAFDASVRAL
ncbi:hypothetical protein RB195_018468 [Necator americanus]|uniref:Cullin N-terminal domain-containing protein n=1 Tax=Necator americanus TaxID=51031 RepID=A0ABR1C9Y4_NECAM